MEKVIYTSEQIQKVIESLDNIEVKGIHNIGMMAQILSILNKPIDREKAEL